MTGRVTSWVRSMSDHPDGEVRIDGLVVRSDMPVALTPLPPRSPNRARRDRSGSPLASDGRR